MGTTQSIEARQTKLFEAARTGDAAEVKKQLNEIMSNKFDSHFLLNEHGQTVWHLAAANGHLNVIEVLISLIPTTKEQRILDPNATDYNQQTPLHLAAANNHLDVVQTLLLEAKADPSMLDDNQESPRQLALKNRHGNTADVLQHAEKLAKGNCIHQAVLSGNTSKLKSRIKKGKADINATDKDGHTPLYLAAATKNFKAVKILLKAGAKTNHEHEVTTPLHAAATNDDNQIAALLIVNGANLKAQNESGETPLEVAVKKNSANVVKTLIAAEAQIKETMLPTAVVEGYDKIVATLARAGATPVVTRHSTLKQTPLHTAALDGNMAMVDALSQTTEVSLHDMIEIRDKNGCTPLFLAIEKLVEHHDNSEKRETFLAIIKKFMAANTLALEIPDENGRKPADLVKNHHNPEIAKTTSLFSLTPEAKFQIALELGNAGIINTLLSENPEFLEKEMDNLTPLQIAVNRNHHGVIQVLLEHGADVEVQDGNGNTLLHTAIRKGDLATASTLITAGAKKFTKNNDGETPLTVAIASGDKNRMNFFTKQTEKCLQKAKEHIKTAQELRGENSDTSTSSSSSSDTENKTKSCRK